MIYIKMIDDGRYTLVNREWERLIKTGRDRVVDLTDQEVFPRELADRAQLRMVLQNQSVLPSKGS